MMHCRECHEKHKVVEITVYKRTWLFCGACGSASSLKEKKIPPLFFLPFDFLKRRKVVTEENIYDYFSTDAHKNVSKRNYDAFMRIFSKHLGGFEEKNIMEISGGSGHFLKFFERNSNYLLLTEFNKKAVEFAQKKLKLDAVNFDFNTDDIVDCINNHKQNLKFDFVFMSACSMFCNDLGVFTSSLKNILNPEAKIILFANVEPTLGVAVRTHFDDFTYYILRTKDRLRSYFEEGFNLIEESEYEDLYPDYVNLHDLNFLTRTLKTFYLEKGIRNLSKSFPEIRNRHSFRYRDRHVFYQVYQYIG